MTDIMSDLSKASVNIGYLSDYQLITLKAIRAVDIACLLSIKTDVLLNIFKTTKPMALRYGAY